MEVGSIAQDYSDKMGAAHNTLENTAELFSEAMLKALNSESISENPLNKLKQKYGKVTYSIGDAAKFQNWDRNDFPVEELFKETIDVNALYSWKPINASVNPTGFERYIQNSLNTITEGSRSVMIHPEVQARMEKDSQYAETIYQKIDTYFQKDIIINESLCPGCTQGIIQFVSIGADGAIDRTCTITNSSSTFEVGNTGKAKKVNRTLLNEIKNTYGEKYFTPQNYEIAMVNQAGMEDEYSLWGYTCEELIRNKFIAGR